MMFATDKLPRPCLDSLILFVSGMMGECQIIAIHALGHSDQYSRHIIFKKILLPCFENGSCGILICIRDINIPKRIYVP